jgi:FixJ family two-component response regulator
MNTKASQGILFVIDDDRKSRMAVAALAVSLKIKCETFVSAEAFLDRYNPSLTGCALVDFRLGGMDGLELQDRLRAMGSALAVVLVSGYADVSLTARAMAGGAVAFIEKPYRNDDLADAVRQALDCSAPARQPDAEQAPERRPGGPISKIAQSPSKPPRKQEQDSDQTQREGARQ